MTAPSATDETLPLTATSCRRVSNRLPARRGAERHAVIAGRNIKHLLRTPQLLVFSVVQTVMFLLLFVYVFGGSIQIPGSTYVDYLIPGYLAQIAIFDGFGVTIFFAEDSKSGLIDRFRALPMARSAVVGGRAIADLLRQAVLLAIHVVGVAGRASGSTAASAGSSLAFVLALVWGFALVLGVRRHRALRPRHRDRAGGVDAVLHPGLRVVVDHPRRHAAGLAAALRPQPAAEPGVQRDAGADGRQRRRGARRALDRALRGHVVDLVRRDHRGVRAARDPGLPQALRPRPSA